MLTVLKIFYSFKKVILFLSSLSKNIFHQEGSCYLEPNLEFKFKSNGIRVVEHKRCCLVLESEAVADHLWRAKVSQYNRQKTKL